MRYSLASVQWATYCVVGSGLLSLVACFAGKTAQYGKHIKEGMAAIDARWAWVVQEVPSFLVPIFILSDVGLYNVAAPNLIVTCLFVLHYFQRTFIYTYLMSKKSKKMPIRFVVMAFMFTSLNGYAIGAHQANFDQLTSDWIRSPYFVCGVLLWFGGFAINLHSDHILRNLRKGDESGYKIPRGGLFEYVSGANFTGEIVEWAGLAMASNFALPLSCFAFSTLLVVGTRAIGHHRWYQQKFEDYPKGRKAVIPFLI